MDDREGNGGSDEPNYSGLDETWRDTNPEFNGGATRYGGEWAQNEAGRGNTWLDAERNRESTRAQRGRAAQDSARDAEDGAAKDNRAGDSARGEENAPFKSNVTGKEDEKKKKGRGMLSLRKAGPFGALLIVIAVAATLVASSQILAPVAILNNLLTVFNSTRIGTNSRSSVIEKMQLSASRGMASSGPVKIFDGDRFSVSEEMARSYAKNHVYVVNDGKVLVFQDPDDQHWLAVVGKEEDKGSAPGSVYIEELEQTVAISEVLSMEEAEKTNDEYDIASTKATQTIRGHIGGWFDTLSNFWQLKMGGSVLRRRHSGVNEDKTDEEVIEDARKGGLAEDVKETREANDTIIDGENKDEKRWKPDSDWDNNSNVRKNPDRDTGPMEEFTPDLEDFEEVVGKNSDGSDKTETVKDWVAKEPHQVSDSDAIPAGTTDEGTIANALESRASKVLSGVGQGVEGVCMIQKAITALNSVITAVNKAKVINYVTGFLEAISKMMAGDGGTELGYYMDKLTRKGNMSDASGGGVILGNMSAMESNGINRLFGGSAPGLTDDTAAVNKYNSENMLKESWGQIGVPAGVRNTLARADDEDAYAKCLGAKIINQTWGIIGDLISPGGRTAVQFIKGIIVAAVRNAIIGAIMGYVKAVLVPNLVHKMAIDYISGVVGPDLAYAIDSGANLYIGGQMQQRSGAPGNVEQVVAMHRENERIIAHDAKIDRLTKSPFDVTSQYTFLGSLAYSMIPISTQLASSSVTGSISTILSTAASSALSLFPAVNAVSRENRWYSLNLNVDCPSLSQYEYVGDPYCNEYYITDFDTIEKDPVDIVDVVSAEVDRNGQSNFLDEEIEEGNPKINPNSELGKWVVSCASREAPYGVADARTASFVLTGNSQIDSIVKTGVSMIPIVGTIAGLIELGEEAADIGWTTGAKCNTDSYKMSAYYSRYSEDQAWAENAGVIEKSAVTAFLEDYYAEHPIDNSLEGVIARFTGWSEEKTAENLALIDYITFLAQYDASERKSFAEDEYEGIPIFESDDDYDGVEGMIVKYVIYFDLRQRALIV